MIGALLMVGFGAWIPIALACYAFGWWWRGRHELAAAPERRLREDPDLAFVSGAKWDGVRIRRPSPFPLEPVTRRLPLRHCRLEIGEMMQGIRIYGPATAKAFRGADLSGSHTIVESWKVMLRGVSILRPEARPILFHHPV